MQENLLDREMARRRATFVGRAAELAVLDHAESTPGPRIVYVHGPGGVGKTSLLHRFAADLRDRGRPAHELDARDLPATPEHVSSALDRAGLVHRGPHPAARRLIVLDTFDPLLPLEPHLLPDLLRRLDPTTLLVVSARLPPSPLWTALPVDLIPLHLRNLAPQDAATYLLARGIHRDALAPIATFAHGHPLALAIAADAWLQRHVPAFDPRDDLGVIDALYDYFIRGIRHPGQRHLLELTAVLPVLDDEAAASLLGERERPHIEWLRGLGFVETSARGHAFHDVAREVILAELRLRDPAALADLVNRALRHCAARVEAASPDAFPRHFADFAFVLSHNPRARALVVGHESDLHLDALQDADTPAILAAIATHEGADEALRARRWLDRQPDAWAIVRRGDAVAGFAAFPRLDRADDLDLAADPLALAAWRHAYDVMGVRSGVVTYCRWFMSCAHHQTPDPAMATASRFVGPLFFTPGFALLVTRMHAWEHWGETARLCGAELIDPLTHESGGKRFLVTVQDHRGLSGVQWLARFCQRTRIADWHLPVPPLEIDASLAALSRESFRAALPTALRDLRDPPLLARSPLLHAQLIGRRVPPRAPTGDRALALAALLHAHIDALQDPLRDVLLATYVRPPTKHEALARALGVSYSTFRRRLAAATEALGEALWRAESEPA